MRALKQRGEALEGLYAQERTRAFKARCGAVRELGLWAAGTLGLDRPDDYAQDLVETDIARPDGADTLLDRLRRDFAESGLPHSELWLRRRIAHSVG